MANSNYTGNDGIIGCALVMGAGMLWGTVGTARMFAPADIPPQVIGAMRLSVSGGILLLMAMLRGDLNGLKRFFGPAVLLAAIGMAAYQIFFFACITRTGVAVGTIVAMGSPPIFAGLIEWVVQQERPNLVWIYATALAVMGCGLLVASGSSLSVDPAGVFLALGAGAAFALFSTAVKRAVVRVPAYATIAVVSTMGALLLSPFLLVENLAWLTEPNGYGVILFLGIFATACPYLLYTLGLRRVNAKTATTLSLVEPLTAGLLGYFFLGERFTLLAILGMTLLLAGFALTSVQAGRARQPKLDMDRSPIRIDR
jgi:DME family drug/metabolite transporter